MPRYRHALPQLAGQPLLTDGGIETVLIFQEGIELPCFASFPVLESEAGRALLTRYLDRHLEVAKRHGVGMQLDSATWRANPEWVARVTGSPDATAGINRAALDFLAGYREQQDSAMTLPISGALGPRGDGYIADSAMTAEQAAEYIARRSRRSPRPKRTSSPLTRSTTSKKQSASRSLRAPAAATRAAPRRR